MTWTSRSTCSLAWSAGAWPEPGYTAVQRIPGIGPTLGAVFVAEIGDSTRFASAPKLTCWAGLTPKHHESDTHVHRGRITKQGSRLVRWAAIESVKIVPAGSPAGGTEGTGRRPPRPDASLSSPSTRCATATCGPWNTPRVWLEHHPRPFPGRCESSR